MNYLLIDILILKKKFMMLSFSSYDKAISTNQITVMLIGTNLTQIPNSFGHCAFIAETRNNIEC